MSHAVYLLSVSPSRMASKVEVDSESGCCLWTAGVREGHPATVKRSTWGRRATRAAWGRARQDDPGHEYMPVSHTWSLEGPGAGAGIVGEPRLARSTPAM